MSNLNSAINQKNGPVFDVQNSLGAKRWCFKEVDEKTLLELQQKHNLPHFIAHLLVQRDVNAQSFESFIAPILREHFPDPFSFAGMEEFARDLAQAITQKKKIGIFADFDVDGTTSAAILTRFLRHFGVEPFVYIPDRLSEGYGPSVSSMQKIKQAGVEYLLMADCGTTAFEPLEHAHDLGLHVSILDHHEAEEELPKVAHVINPKRKDDNSGLEMLAACGVCFMACVAVNAKLRESGYFKENALQEAPLKSWLDLVALGTVCDMVPLLGVNRLFVKYGFEQMGKHENAGLEALCQVGRITNLPEPKDAGWSLGPRINAGSRVHKSDLGAKLLSTDDKDEAQSIAWALEECNKERRAIQAEMIKVATNKIEFHQEEHKQAPFILVDDESFHSGLSGLVAGQLKERYGRPAMVVTYVENAEGVMEGRGSGRSIPGINMADIFIAARGEDLLVKGGGHAMAGGFTIEPDKLDDFRKFVDSYIRQQTNNLEPVQDLDIDGFLSVRGASQLASVKMMHEQVGPFGTGNPEPIFALPHVRVQRVDVLKDKHIRMMVADSEGGSWMKAMFFSGVDTDLGTALLKDAQNTLFHLAGQFQVNNWQGRESVEFHVKDGALAI
ncbi:MAG: single-stranded-DNA-specific exonuclease RecJ [Alphaproteobacteria bacterium]|nr:single-stranded-DNA-specific exonuclease RecJ [Alphaproteobacteria bacterium]